MRTRRIARSGIAFATWWFRERLGLRNSRSENARRRILEFKEKRAHDCHRPVHDSLKQPLLGKTTVIYGVTRRKVAATEQPLFCNERGKENKRERRSIEKKKNLTFSQRKLWNGLFSHRIEISAGFFFLRHYVSRTDTFRRTFFSTVFEIYMREVVKIVIAEMKFLNR